MASLAQFSRNIRKRGSQIENAGTEITKRAAKTFLRSVVLGTPVDKGVARSNWRVGIGARTRSVIPAYAPGRKLGISETANARAAISAGVARINSVRGAGRSGLATSIYVSNNVDYIGGLESGRISSQNKGFIARARDEAILAIRSFRIFGAGSR